MAKNEQCSGEISIPDSDNEGAKEASSLETTRKRGAEHPSPTKIRRGEDRPVTESMLRDTLKCLRSSAQKATVSDALQALRGSTKCQNGRQVREAGDKDAADGDKTPVTGRGLWQAQVTMITGGWERDTRRRRSSTSWAPAPWGQSFTSGPLRSLAMTVFKICQGETATETRERMIKVIETIKEGSIVIPESGKRLWAGFSKLKLPATGEPLQV